MQRQLSLRVTPNIAASEHLLTRYAAGEIGIDARTIKALRIRRRSIDARQRTIYVNLTVDLFINEMPPRLDYEPVEYTDVSHAPRVVVVGAGPGGLFAALRLIELGLRPVVLERGKDVHERRKDIALISLQHKVTEKVITPLAKAVPVPTLTANFSPVPRNVAMWKRFCASSANSVLPPISLLMPILTSVPTDCHASSKACATKLSPVAAKYISKPV